MNKQDKIIAIGGVVLIILLAVVAVLLLFRPSEYVSLVAKEETVELKEEPQETVTNTEISDVASEKTADETKTEEVTTSNKDEAENDGPLSEYYVKAECKKIKNDDSQMKELYNYWDQYQLDAVSDLIRLDRIRMFTKELSGTNQYYYYGDVNDDLVPNGKGLAIYADDTYYFGEWSNGIREGEGMWLRIYVGKSATEGKETGIVEHQYSGIFKNDLPNGEGQEHCTVADADITNDMTIVNAIGNFKNGYYDGDMFIMTQNRDGDRYDWYASAGYGKFAYCVENKVSTTGKRPVWSKGEDNNHETDDSDDGYYWMKDEENTNYGIYGLKKQN